MTALGGLPLPRKTNTFGNFEITTNLEKRSPKNFTLGGQWSEYYSLDNLNLTESQSVILESNNLFIRLNFDIYNISRYVYFGSFHEFVRVTLEQIIQKWKGSLYLNPQITNTIANTVLSFSYDEGNNTSKFLIPTSLINNPYELIYEDNNNFNNLTQSDIFNIARDYEKYVIWNGNQEFGVIAFTGSTSTNPYLTVITKGNPFPSLTGSTFGQFTYHFKPNNVEVQLFFDQLEDFERIILNRLTTPKYTSYFTTPTGTDDGFVFFSEKYFTWPTTDGYNLDNNTRDYGLYVEGILNMALDFDRNKTDLMTRRFVSESILEYDTNDGNDEIYSRKVHKLLRIYGREFDEVKKYIDGISFANVVTYNKLDNTSDELIKIIAKNLGFDVLLTWTTDNFNLLQQTQPATYTHFSGYSRSLSAKELDVELWRRLVINAWWLFRSKGTRKVIEFFFNLFNIPQCMITLDEYVYLAENRLDVIETYNQLYQAYELNGGGISLTDLMNDSFDQSPFPMDDYGFPRVLPQTLDNYFQKGGFWYNGGTDITTGNNPHIGPYDYGKNYFDQFECFIPVLDAVTSTTFVTIVNNYFNNYNQGTFLIDENGLPIPYYGPNYATVLNNPTLNLTQNVNVTQAGLTYIGDPVGPLYDRPDGDGYFMKVSFTAGESCTPGIRTDCSLNNLFFGSNGIVYTDSTEQTPLLDQTCCQFYWLLNDGDNDGDRTTPCPNQTNIYLDNDVFYVLPNNTPLTEGCCNQNFVGVDVYWDVVENFCKRRTNNVTLTQSNITTTNYSATELFNNSLKGNEITSTPNFYCYWCPPSRFVSEVCDVSDFSTILTNYQINQFATNLGWNGTNPVDPLNYISLYYNSLFEQGCILFNLLDKPISSEPCCNIVGGTWTQISGNYYCVRPRQACSMAEIKTIENRPTHVWIESNNNELVSIDCCNQTGMYWYNGTGIEIATGQNIQPTYLTDSVGQSQAGSTTFCSNCPQKLKADNLDAVTDFNTSQALSEICCNDYGFTYDRATEACYYCPRTINNQVTSFYVNSDGIVTNPTAVGTTITVIIYLDPNGNNLSEQCCNRFNGWYGNAFNNGNKCYECPSYNVWNNGVKTVNTNYSISNGQVLYAGRSLSESCCRQYSQQTNTITSYSGGRCLIR